ncbi:hypothetical protein GCM10011487_21790 [Steroidobacter agaridevorans]|uniref:DUF1552 domain-containing protein n=1 Tax=Steroidobacter agaridevorans TaxID=2695856 RepID=A0A829YA42_9GAMM|nr:DUF1552 domain-containing protein [Steroidobacter agaridevorans]GFE80179.1 hypothetical protein GCM10011487_21790 [Steroidobacter agaridevorans]GFE89851.1 hypothetical protein GCM10011488_48050 [Steroidobacter agaridevorans]
MKDLSRRRVLRGMFNGAAVSVALPLLNCFLNDNGTALASGAPLPQRFGTWSWGLGMSKSIFVPKKTGAGFDLPEEIAMFAPIRDQMNLYTNYNAFRDAAPNLCHTTGWVILRSGSAPLNQNAKPGETIDVTVAKKIGTTTRFPMLTVTATGDPRDTQSYESATSVNNAEGSPLALYASLFGADYQDPNAKDFTPSPKILVRKSVLSNVSEDAKKLMTQVGAEDKARIDQYFTNLRELERQLDRQLQKPEPREACVKPKLPPELATGVDFELVAQRHRLFTDLLVMAVACDQTRVFNATYSKSFSSTTKPGYEKPHHTASHEEPMDPKLGYQPMVSWFLRRGFEEWVYFVQAFSKVKEGDGTLLDNMLIYASTDQSFAKIHSIDGLPMFSAGRAGGRIKTGLHIDGAGTPGTRLGYTMMKTLGVDIPSWGTQSNSTSKEISEILV